LFYAISGMETGLYIFLFFCVVRVANSDPSPRMAALSGILTGLLFLTRIEGAMCMFAFAALIAIVDLSPRNKLHLLAIAGSLFICVIAPWELFLFLKAGIVVPTSGSGRLFLYFPIQGLELSQYISLSLLQRLSYVGEIFQSNFIAHPLQLFMGIIPIVGTVAFVGIAHFSRTMPAAKVRRDVVMFLAIYCSLNLCIYFLFQPLIFQRYLIAAVPSFIICLLAVAPWKGATGRFRLRAWARIGISASLVSALAFINWIGVRYFDTPTTRDTQIIALFKQLDASVGNAPCRLAAEPLGVAAYFTRCYVVDLGGLINPDLWPYWIRAGRKGLGQATMQYAIDRHANFVYSSDGSLPSGFADQFELRYQIAPPWAIFEFKGPTRQ